MRLLLTYGLSITSMSTSTSLGALRDTTRSSEDSRRPREHTAMHLLITSYERGVWGAWYSRLLAATHQRGYNRPTSQGGVRTGSHDVHDGIAELGGRRGRGGAPTGIGCRNSSPVC